MTTTKSKKRKSLRPYHLVTNHLNLLYMLAAGLVMEPSGFRGKHYADSLSLIPGWIPLFRDAIPADALSLAVSERKHLRPCIASFDLSDVSASVYALSREGRLRRARFPNLCLQKKKGEIGILIRPPLPLTLLSRIYFASAEDRKVFETAAGNVSNVDLQPYSWEVEKSLFEGIDAVRPPTWIDTDLRRNAAKKYPGEPLPLPINEDSRHDPETFSEQALGGLLAMLHHCANRSELGVKIFQLATKAADAVSIPDPILAELPNWLNGADLSGHENTPVGLFWGVADLLSREGQQPGPPPVDRVLTYLDAQLAHLDETNKARLEHLIRNMRNSMSLGAGTITDIFERNQGSLSRALLLFCLLEHGRDLLEFSHPLLSDAEYLSAGILFGIRDGWLGLPCEMRSRPLSAYIMSRMADFAHEKQGNDFSGPEMPSPQPLRALFPAEGESWDSSYTDLAVEIAQAGNRQDCLETVIASADGSPLDEPKRENGTFIFSGETTSTLTIKPEVFLKRLGEWPPMDRELEVKVRNDLDRIKKEGTAQS